MFRAATTFTRSNVTNVCELISRQLVITRSYTNGFVDRHLRVATAAAAAAVTVRLLQNFINCKS